MAVLNVDVNEILEEIEEEEGITVAAAPPFPAGFNKQTPPPSGFVDEPHVYEEVEIGETTAQKKLKEKTFETLRPIMDKVGPSAQDLLNSEDAMVWAEAFVLIRKNRLEDDGFDIAEDAGVMVGWFANAFARGEYSSPHYKRYVEEKLAKFEAERTRNR